MFYPCRAPGVHGFFERFGFFERNETYDVLSTSSPLGQALDGRRVGETTTYETPRKSELHVEIVAIRPL